MTLEEVRYWTELVSEGKTLQEIRLSSILAVREFIVKMGEVLRREKWQSLR